MGITISCKKTGRSIDMGYGGFNRLRNKVAELAGGPFAKHYLLLDAPENIKLAAASLISENRDQFFDWFDQRTQEIIDANQADIKIVNFLLQSDCEGKVHYGACKNILRTIGDYDDDVLYGYCGRPDCAKFKDFKAILKDCINNKCDMVWR